MCSVNSKLREHVHNWQNIGANDTILNWIVHGASIPFLETLHQFEHCNKHFSEQDAALIDDEIAKLADSGAIREFSERPQCVSSTDLVPVWSIKQRLLLQ